MNETNQKIRNQIALIAFKEILRQFLAVEAKTADKAEDVIPTGQRATDIGIEIARSAMTIADGFSDCKTGEFWTDDEFQTTV